MTREYTRAGTDRRCPLSNRWRWIKERRSGFDRRARVAELERRAFGRPSQIGNKS